MFSTTCKNSTGASDPSVEFGNNTRCAAITPATPPLAPMAGCVEVGCANWCAMLPTNVYGINLGDRRFDPIYETAQALNMPLSVHPQTGHDGQYGVNSVMGAGSERMEKYAYVHMTAFPFEAMIAMMHMIGEGVFDRYPRLKVAYMEGAAGWLPSLRLIRRSVFSCATIFAALAVSGGTCPTKLPAMIERPAFAIVTLPPV